MNALGKAGLGIGALVLAGGLAYYLFERSTEQPSYRTILADGRFEVRQYPALLVAETITTGPREEALNHGFRALAAYIFAKSRGGEKIAMTAPVVQERGKLPMTAPVVQGEAAEGGWTTRFIMPARFSRATLPAPPPGVTIREVPPRRMAAIRFGGRADDRAIEERSAELRGWMAKQDLGAGGLAEYAFYNSPFIPPLLRRNEILIPAGRGG